MTRVRPGARARLLPSTITRPARSVTPRGRRRGRGWGESGQRLPSLAFACQDPIPVMLIAVAVMMMARPEATAAAGFWARIARLLASCRPSRRLAPRRPGPGRTGRIRETSAKAMLTKRFAHTIGVMLGRNAEDTGARAQHPRRFNGPCLRARVAERLSADVRGREDTTGRRPPSSCRRSPATGEERDGKREQHCRSETRMHPAPPHHAAPHPEDQTGHQGSHRDTEDRRLPSARPATVRRGRSRPTC